MLQSSALAYSGFAVDDISGNNFYKDFLGIDLSDKYGLIKKRSYFVVYPGDDEWVCYPPTMPMENTVIGIREVFHFDSNHVLVRIIEFHPTAGRQYFNFYNTNSWDGWKTLTPS